MSVANHLSSSCRACFWAIAAIVALRGWTVLGQALLVAGALSAALCRRGFPTPEPAEAVTLPIRLAGEAVTFRMAPEALWLMGFGLAPAVFACPLASPSKPGGRRGCRRRVQPARRARRVRSLERGRPAGRLGSDEPRRRRDDPSDRLEPSRGRTVLFMLALLEVGAVALLLAVAARPLGPRLDFAQFAAAAPSLSAACRSASASSSLQVSAPSSACCRSMNGSPAPTGRAAARPGAILSGVVLNAAFFGLAAV